MSYREGCDLAQDFAFHGFQIIVKAKRDFDEGIGAVNDNLAKVCGQFGDAAKACDAAIAKTLAGRQLKAAENAPAERRYAAIALSNRGVLRALMGKEAGAEADFSAAVELKARVGAPKRNLEYLQARADGAVTLLQTDQ